MLRIPIALGAACLGMAMLALAPARADDLSYQRTAQYAFQPGGASTLSLRNQNGDVTLLAADVSAIDVRARVSTDSQASAQSFFVSAEGRDGVLHIQAFCPKAGRRNFIVFSVVRCNVDFTIRYPKRMAVDVLNDNGDVEIDQPQGAISAHDTNGDVRVKSAANSLDLSTRHGDLAASLQKHWLGTSISMAVSIGDLRLSVPQGFRARLDAQTGLGDFTDAAGLKQSGGSIPVSLRSRIGDVLTTH